MFQWLHSTHMEYTVSNYKKIFDVSGISIWTENSTVQHIVQAKYRPKTKYIYMCLCYIM